MSRHGIGAYLVLAAASLNFAAAQGVPSALTIDESTNAVYSSDESGTLTMRQGRTEKWRVNLGLSPQDKVHSLVLGRTGELYAAGSRNQSGFLVKLGAGGTVVASLPTTKPARALAIDAAGAVWLGSDGFLTGLDDQLTPIFNVDPQGSVASLAIDRKGSVYAAIAAGTNAVTGKLDASTQTWAWRTEMGGVAPRGIALDEDGSVYVTGDASSPALIVSHAAQDHLIGPGDAFVARLDSSGAVQWSTYLGGSGTDSASSIVVTTDGNVVIGGATTSPDFPGADAPWSGTAHGFLARLNSAGHVLQSAYLARPVTARVGFSHRMNRGDTAAGIMSAALQSSISMSADPCSITVTSTNDSGPGSLRQAVADAAGCAGQSNIGFAVSGTITLASRILINTSVDINGPGIANLTISGNNLTRIFFMGTGTTTDFSGAVTIRNLTLANGLGKGGDSGFGGGGAGMGGAIFQNGGTLTLANVLLLGNRALGGSSGRVNFNSGGGFGGDAVAGHGADGGDLAGLGGADATDLGRTGKPGGVGGGGGMGGPGNEQTDSGIGGAGGFGGGGGSAGINDFEDAIVGGNGGDGGFGGGSGLAPGPGGGSGRPGFGGESGVGAGFGAAVFARSGFLTLANTYFEDNSSVGGNNDRRNGAGKGGGLFLFQMGTQGVLASAGASHFLANTAAQAGVPQLFPADNYGVGDRSARLCPGVDTVDVCGTLSGTPQFDTVAIIAGNNQSAPSGDGFPVNLKLQVTNGGTGVSGIPIVFIIQPANGTGGSFSGNLSTVFTTTDASGFATAPALTASGPVGSFTVRAAGAVFHLSVASAVLTANPGTTPQSALVNSQFAPLSVTLATNLGSPLAGRSVTFTAPAGGASGTFSNNTNSIVVTTDASGVATAPFKANLTLGTYQVTASALALSTSFSLTNIVGPPASITANPGATPQSTIVNTPFANPPAVTVKDASGNAISGASIMFTAPATGASGTFANNTNSIVVTTDAAGVATAPFKANLTVGSYQVTASTLALSTTFSLTNTVGPPASITANPGATPQSTIINTAFPNPLAVTVKDASGNLISGALIVFTAPAAGASGTFSNNTNSIVFVTDASGVATVPFKANLTVGSYQVTAAILSLSTAFSLTNTVGPPASITANPGTTPQSTNINTAFANPLAVTVKDASDNVISGASVVFTAPVTGAGGAFSNSSSTITLTTDATGVASGVFTANGTGGPYSVTATVNGLSATFSLTNTAAPVISTNPVAQTVAAFATVTFTAAAGGFPGPTVKWQVSTSGGPFTDIAGASSTTLSFPADGTQNGNQYRAVFTNSAGSTTTTAATLTVTKLNPAITWTNPADILFGTALGAAQLNASGSIGGTFAYTPIAGTVLNAGNGQTLSVLFTPADSANYNTATATVRINVLPLQSVTVMPAASGQYSDVVTLSATVSQIIGAGSLQFQVAGINVGPAVPVAGAGTYSTSYTIANGAGTYPISAIFTPATTNFLGSSASNTLTAGKEDAAITTAANNPQTVRVNAPGGSAGPITFTGTVAETADGSSGDINRAAVAVTLVPAVAGTPNIDCPVTNNNGSLTVTCSNVPVNAYTILWSYNGNYYQGATVNTVLAIFDPSLGFVTGSGTVLDNGVRGDFALSVQYQKNGLLQGGLTYVEHRAGGDVKVSTTALSSMSIVDNTAVIMGQATVNGVAGYSLQLTVADNGEPGVNHDTFGLQLSGGILTPPISFASTTIVAGNLQTH